MSVTRRPTDRPIGEIGRFGCQRQNNQPTHEDSYILYVAANTCMVRAVLYCTVLYCAHLAIFMQYTGVFPTIQLEIPTFHSIYAQVQLGILALKSTNQPELDRRIGGSKRRPPP